jgi:chorismate lyase
MRFSDHIRRRDRHARSADRGGWLPQPPLNLRPGLAGEVATQLVVQGWLREAGSLTARLRKYGATRVRRVRQTRARPNRDELWFLGSPQQRRFDSSIMVREVVLEVDGVPWVFAHTLANAPAVRMLRRAGRNALAAVLFTDPQVFAGCLHYKRVDQRHPLYQSAIRWCGNSGLEDYLTLSGRRALFRRGAARLLVTEVFLPPSLCARKSGD